MFNKIDTFPIKVVLKYTRNAFTESLTHCHKTLFIKHSEITSNKYQYL